MTEAWKPTRDEIVAAAGTVDLPAFIEEVLGLRCKGFHKSIIQHTEENQRCLILVPTGHGKTQVITISKVLQEVIKNPDIRILIITHTANYSYRLSDEIRQWLTSPEVLRYYGEQKSDVWARDKLNVRWRKRKGKEPTIEFAGAGNPIIGGHYDLIILDDVVTEEGARSKTQRQALKDWFWRVVFKRKDPGTRFIIIGTRYDPRDLYQEFIDINQRMPGRWPVLKMGALLLKETRQPVSMDVSPEELEKMAREGLLAPLWRRETVNGQQFGYPVDELIEERTIEGPINFGLTRQNDVEAAKGAIFKEKWFKWYDPRSMPRDIAGVCAGVDAPVKSEQQHDFFANVAVAVTSRGKFFILPDIFKDRITVQHMIDNCADYACMRHNKHPYANHQTVIEGVGAQHWLFEFVVKKFHLNPNIPDHSGDFSVLAKPERDKVYRYRRISSLFEQGRVFFPQDNLAARKLADNLIEAPKVEHDDDIDALEMALRKASESAYEPVEVQTYAPAYGGVTGDQAVALFKAHYANVGVKYDEDDDEESWYL